MRECKLNTYWKNQTFTAVCIYIFLYISIYIHLHCSFNCPLTKEIQWTEQSSINSPSWSSSGRTGFQLGQQHFILTAFLLTESKHVRRNWSQLCCLYLHINRTKPFFHFEPLPKSKAAWSKQWVEDNSDSSIMLLQWQYSLNFMTCKPEGMLLDHPSEIVTYG